MFSGKGGAMALFAIGDLHLSLGCDKPMDIFSGWSNYVPLLKENWNSVVNENDTVVIPGDVSWAMDFETLKPDFEFIEKLPGKKIILKGNHDYWWCTMSKMKRFIEENGFHTISILHNSAAVAEGVSICGSRGWFFDEAEGGDRKILLREAGRLETSVREAEKTGLEPVVFLHFPPVYGNMECPEIIEILKNHHIKRCYYGHLHGKAIGKAVTGAYKDIIFRLVSSDALRFFPLIIN